MSMISDEKATFYLVVPPGFEALALSELELKFTGLEVQKKERGGLTVIAPYRVGLAFCAILKIPTMVLLRITEFKCRDLPKLYQKISNVRWGRYLLGDRFELHVTSSRSRLLHEKKIASTISEGIARHFQKQPAKKLDAKQAQLEPFEVYVRFYEDVCTLSLNLCGEPLFKRGYKGLENEQTDGESPRAPLRENLAAGLFFALWQVTGGFTQLVDPMCGSGTFLYEASYFMTKNASREFAYQKHAEWVESEIFLTSEIGEGLKLDGYDRDEKVLQRARLILPKANLQVRDFFSFEKKGQTQNQSQRSAFICNPPYGVRLKLPTQPKIYYTQLIQNMLAESPVGVGIILPQKFKSQIAERFGSYQLKNEIEFENGGLPVVFRIYAVDT